MYKICLFQVKLKIFFINILLAKSQPSTVAMVYWPPNESGFLNDLNGSFYKLDTFTREIYTLVDFSINLFLNVKNLLASLKI